MTIAGLPERLHVVDGRSTLAAVLASGGFAVAQNGKKASKKYLIMLDLWPNRLKASNPNMCVQKKRAGEQSALVMFYPYLLYGRYLVTGARRSVWSLYPTRVFAMCSAEASAA